MKSILFISLLLVFTNAFSQKLYKSKSEIYSFEMPPSYQEKPSNHERNEFIFVNNGDTTSLVVNVNDQVIDENYLKGFRKASNEMVEQNFYRTISNPKIVKRGDMVGDQQQSIYFHVTHATTKEAENNYMMNYLFFHKGKEINFIFRTKQRRLDKVLPEVDAIVKSVKLL